MSRGQNMLARKALRTLFGRSHMGTLSVTWSDGSYGTFIGSPAEPTADLSIQDERAFLTSVVNRGSVGLADAYLEGIWTTDDLAGFLELAVRIIDQRTEAARKRRTMTTLRRWWGNKPDIGRGRVIEEIGDHYNLGNDFYAAWLDPSMTYSSALGLDRGSQLQQAQARKYERLCELLELKAGERVLEIGCGWGGFAEHAASKHGVHVTGLTLSREQAAYARDRLANAGLSDATDVRIQDFRDERDMYDKVVSIEMIESVDETLWPPLFHAIARAIPPGGKAAMQAITIDDRFYDSLLKRDDFIKTFIFPGGALPSVGVLKNLVSDAGLSWVDAQAHGSDYARTLNEWAVRFESAWPGIVDTDPTFDERFHRMWRYYLEYCEAGFRTGRIDGYQILIERPVR